MNYSVDALKKAAFHDELQNVLKVLAMEAPDRISEDLVAVIKYLEKRLKEFESMYKN